MKRKHFSLLAVIPAFVLVSVVGAGFATWYWEEQSNMDLAAKVAITDEVANGFTVAVKDSKTAQLVLDQANGRNHPESDPARGIFLGYTDWEEKNFAGTDGIAITVSHTGEVPGTATLHCIASWTGSNTNADKHLTLTKTELTTALTFTGSDATYTDDVTIGAKSGDINLGIHYVTEPTESSTYNTMKTELKGLTLTLNFYVTVSE